MEEPIEINENVLSEIMAGLRSRYLPEFSESPDDEYREVLLKRDVHVTVTLAQWKSALQMARAHGWTPEDQPREYVSPLGCDVSQTDAYALSRAYWDWYSDWCNMFCPDETSESNEAYEWLKQERRVAMYEFFGKGDAFTVR